MGLQRSPWAGINVHGGARDRMAELRAAVDALPDAVRSRLTLENCERAYSVPDLRAVGVPVVWVIEIGADPLPARSLTNLSAESDYITSP